MMTIVVACEALDALELTQQLADHEHILVPNAQAFEHYPSADLYIDHRFNGGWFSPATKPLLINCVALPFASQDAERPAQVARYCGWPGFWARSVWELAVPHGTDAGWLATTVERLGKTALCVGDVPGLITARVWASLANEACYAIADAVATANNIDVAMRLGTNYPAGPLEWVSQMGAHRVWQLLEAMATENDIYTPHPLIKALT
jgi:3-hydroxybutyryl-CoA dehydrogenase